MRRAGRLPVKKRFLLSHKRGVWEHVGFVGARKLAGQSTSARAEALAQFMEARLLFREGNESVFGEGLFSIARKAIYYPLDSMVTRGCIVGVAVEG